MLRIDKLKAGRLPPLSFSVSEGECLAVEGPSGSGKTTLLRAIADLDPATGQVFLDGAERSEMSAPEWRRKVCYCSAEPAWWTASARDALPKEARRGFDDKGRGTRLSRLLASLALDQALLDRPIGTLSTGERQRMAIVRALAGDPKVLLLDEPTGALDLASAGLVEELIRFVLLSGKAVVVVSHDVRQVERLASARLQLGPAMPVQTGGWS